MNIQIRKFYELDETDGGGSIDWYNRYCFVNKELTELKKLVKEKDLIINGTEERCENLKVEYDKCYEMLFELVAVKKINDEQGKTAEYISRQPKAWEAAKTFIENHPNEC